MSQLFSLGQIVTTPGIQELNLPELVLSGLLNRHSHGDWGNISEPDATQNLLGVQTQGMIMSAYPIDPKLPNTDHGDNCIWVITDPGHATTTVLLPDEY